MAKADWQIQDFHSHSGYLTYQGKFVARFKYKAGSVADFRKFLVAYFSPAEYFARLEAGEAPLTILQSKGYILPHVRKMLTAANLPYTQEGVQELLKGGI